MYRKKFKLGNFSKNGSTFEVENEKFMIQQQFNMRLVRLKPTFDHVSKLVKVGDNKYAFDTISGNKKFFYTMSIQDDKVVISEKQ